MSGDEQAFTVRDGVGYLTAAVTIPHTSNGPNVDSDAVGRRAILTVTGGFTALPAPVSIVEVTPGDKATTMLVSLDADPGNVVAWWVLVADGRQEPPVTLDMAYVGPRFVGTARMPSMDRYPVPPMRDTVSGVLAELLHARGMTVRQPWATAILHGGKDVENRPRPWPTGVYLLHAGKGWDRDAGHHPQVASLLDGPHGITLPSGGVIGLMRVTSRHQAVPGCCASPWGIWPADGDGPVWHHVLTDVTALPDVVPSVGRLGPWVPAPAVLAAIRKAFPDAA
ncbi:MAG TPA: hypothetical protein VFP72_23170 [Kineosporiaceae bacterium]|nr:hypothetical protein [Kineosporiaceae bacterium]